MQLNEPQINIRDTKNYAEFLIISSKKIFYLFIIESVIKDKKFGVSQNLDIFKNAFSIQDWKSKKERTFFPQ